MKIDETELYHLLNGRNSDTFKLIEDEITASDPEDGGADHKFVIKEVSTNKFYRGFYSDWDIDYNTTLNDNKVVIETDLNCELEEVFPEEVTRTIYTSK